MAISRILANPTLAADYLADLVERIIQEGDRVYNRDARGRFATGPGGGAGGKADPVDHLKSLLATKGGFSFNLNTGEVPKDGYMVSPYKDREVILPSLAAFNRRSYRKYTVQNHDLLSQTGHHIGGWLAKDGRVYLDVSIRVSTPEEADGLAVQHSQKDYYDVANDKVVLPSGRKRP